MKKLDRPLFVKEYAKECRKYEIFANRMTVKVAELSLHSQQGCAASFGDCSLERGSPQGCYCGMDA